MVDYPKLYRFEVLVPLVNQRLHWISDFANVKKNVPKENHIPLLVTYEFQMENCDWLLYLGHTLDIKTPPHLMSWVLCVIFLTYP